MDPFIVFLTIVISILSLVLVIAGIYVIFILRNINKTLSRANHTLDYIDQVLHHVTNPLTDLKALGQGVKTGLQVAEHIVTWVKTKRAMNNQTPTNKKSSGTGFTLGVALGALIGTGAMILARTSEGKEATKNIKDYLHKATKTLQEKYPEESEEVSHILHQALVEAQKATDEIKDLSKHASEVVRQKTSQMQESLKAAHKQPIKRTFSRSGKPLQ